MRHAVIIAIETAWRYNKSITHIIQFNLNYFQLRDSPHFHGTQIYREVTAFCDAISCAIICEIIREITHEIICLLSYVN